MFPIELDLEFQTPRILVIDDDPESRWLLTRILFRQGYIAESAQNGEEAFLKLILFPSPDLILMDLEMPVMDGETFRRIQLEYDRFALIPVILRSAHPRVETIAKTLQVAAVSPKTEPLSHLIATIDTILKKKGA